MGWFRAPAGGHHSDHRCRLPLCNEESAHAQTNTNWVIGVDTLGQCQTKLAVCLRTASQKAIIVRFIG